MNRDKPPFGPSDDKMRPSGGRDSWNDRNAGESAPRGVSEREVADRYRLARGDQRNPPSADEFGRDDRNPPSRGLERLNRFVRDGSDGRSQGGEEGFPQPVARPSFADREKAAGNLPSLKRPAFLDRASKDAARTEPRRPSFLDEPEVDTSALNNDVYGDRPQPVRRSFRATPQERAGNAPGGDRSTGGPGSKDTSGLTDWSMVSNERSNSATSDAGFEHGEPGQESEPPPPPSRDWRSSRFASRFAQPPKAYDLDEVADHEVSFDQDPGISHDHGGAQEMGSGYREEDLAAKARERSRSRFESSRGVPGEAEHSLDPLISDRYDPYDQPEAILPSQIADSRSFDAAYEAENGPAGGAYLSADGGEAGYDPRISEDYGYQAAPEEDYRDYPPRDDTVGGVDEYSMQAPGRQNYGGPTGQAYDDEVRDPYALEDDRDRHGYDNYADFDAQGRPLTRDAYQPRDPYTEHLDPRGDEYDTPDCAYERIEKENTRKPVVLIGAMVGVAVLAGGTVFAYQMLTPEQNKEVPVVKLEEAPSKVAPNEPGGLDIPHQNKLFYDRIVGETTAVAEKIVPREEPVIELESDKIAIDAVVPPAPDNVVPDRIASVDDGRDEAAAILQNGDESGNGANIPAEATAEPAAISVAPEPPLPTAPDTRIASIAETVEPPAALPPVPKIKPRAPQRVAVAAVEERAASGKKLLTERIPQGDDGESSVDRDLSSEPASSVPDGPASDPDGPASASAAVQSAARSADEQQYMIQIAAFRTEPEAQAEFRRLQGKHTDLLDSFGPVIQKADLGDRGVYYRLRVGPIASRQDASSLCTSLIEAGERDCLVRVRPQ